MPVPFSVELDQIGGAPTIAPSASPLLVDGTTFRPFLSGAFSRIALALQRCWRAVVRGGANSTDAHIWGFESEDRYIVRPTIEEALFSYRRRSVENARPPWIK